MEFYIVEAFSCNAFGGNTAGVVFYENLREEVMLKVAAELRYSETAFIKQLSENKFNIRFFTPNSEVKLCGHASVASFKVLQHKGAVKEEEDYYMETKAGLLKVEILEDNIYIEADKPMEGRELIDNFIKERISDTLNISVSDIGDNNLSLEPMIVSTGLYDIMLPVKNKAILNSIKPNFRLLSQLTKELAVGGIHAFTLDSGEYTARCRNFAPLLGIDEEAATGTSNASLTYFLYSKGVIKSVNKVYEFIQGEAMNRPSLINTLITEGNAQKILMGGSAYILASGELYL